MKLDQRAILQTFLKPFFFCDTDNNLKSDTYTWLLNDFSDESLTDGYMGIDES